jgi:preprotein translocase subunit SecG
VALLVCALFITASLISVVYIVSNADHTHDHNGSGGACETCIHITSAANLLKQIGTALTAAVIVFGLPLGLLSNVKTPSVRSDLLSLVGLKVRLNN